MSVWVAQKAELALDGAEEPRLGGDGFGLAHGACGWPNEITVGHENDRDRFASSHRVRDDAGGRDDVVIRMRSQNRIAACETLLPARAHDPARGRATT